MVIYKQKPGIQISQDKIYEDVAFLDISGNSIFKGNEIILDIWKLLPATKTDLVTRLADKYEAEFFELQNVVQNSIDLLVSYGLIQTI